ncbi:MAG: septum formation inhibitor Maf [Magnetococcales bacterium]|nr:septum formation inhibitor Maf [Magnetococcales bacterium]
MELILASTSRIRRQLLERLGLSFTPLVPHTDETPLPGEAPRDLALRLAESKARSRGVDHPNALIIGSDQVAVLAGEVVGKPGNHARAKEQLLRSSGKRLDFLTGLAVYNPARERMQGRVVSSAVYFRELSPEQIDRYLQRDEPYASAGSFHAEGLGIALFQRMEGEDPTAILGLPLMALTTMLEQEGVLVV